MGRCVDVVGVVVLHVRLQAHRVKHSQAELHSELVGEGLIDIRDGHCAIINGIVQVAVQITSALTNIKKGLDKKSFKRKGRTTGKGSTSMSMPASNTT
jgi:hypothetical protein